MQGMTMQSVKSAKQLTAMETALAEVEARIVDLRKSLLLVLNRTRNPQPAPPGPETTPGPILGHVSRAQACIGALAECQETVNALAELV